jgi:5-methylcytosine-specific restriction endonuclease McrA
MKNKSTKNCSNPECGQNNPQPSECFGKKTSAKDGLQSRCRSCISLKNAKNYKKNAEKIKTKRNIRYREDPSYALEYSARNYKENPEKVKAETAEWQRKNPEKFIIIKNRWIGNNKHKIVFYANKRRTAKLNAAPSWLTEKQYKEIEEFYVLAKELQWLSEEPLHVDHIVPLQGENVSGLHVPWNLQILPRSMNSSKGNKVL